MVRRLPDDPIKRRREYFKRAYQHREHWEALREDRGMSDVITSPEGEDIYLGDLLVGINHLPERQRQAFVLICMKGFTEPAARDELLPNSKSSTPVQQYADSGLIRMMWAYDLKQEGKWPPPEKPKKTTNRKPKTRRKIVAQKQPVHPLIRKHLDEAEKDILTQIHALESALAEVREMRGDNQQSAQLATPSQQPAPTPQPEGKPTLAAAAKDLAGV